MKKYILAILLLLIVALITMRILTPEDTWDCVDGQWVKHGNPDTEAPATGCDAISGKDPKNTTYIVNNMEVTLVDGKASNEVVEGASSTVVTSIFGEPVYADLNSDGLEDAVVFLVQETGGTGSFFSFAVAVKNNSGYVGTEAIPLGDRIAPQNINIKDDGIIAVNYADRKAGEPMTADPSVGVTAYAVLEGSTLSTVPASVGGGGGILPFESGIKGTITVGPQCPVVKADEPCPDLPYVGKVNIFRASNRRNPFIVIETNKEGKFEVSTAPGDYIVIAGDNTKFPSCGEKAVTVGPTSKVSINIACDSGIR